MELLPTHFAKYKIDNCKLNSNLFKFTSLYCAALPPAILSEYEMEWNYVDIRPKPQTQRNSIADMSFFCRLGACQTYSYCFRICKPTNRYTISLFNTIAIFDSIQALSDCL